MALAWNQSRPADGAGYGGSHGSLAQTEKENYSLIHVLVHNCEGSARCRNSFGNIDVTPGRINAWDSVMCYSTWPAESMHCCWCPVSQFNFILIHLGSFVWGRCDCKTNHMYNFLCCSWVCQREDGSCYSSGSCSSSDNNGSLNSLDQCDQTSQHHAFSPFNLTLILNGLLFVSNRVGT